MNALSRELSNQDLGSCEARSGSLYAPEPAS